MDTLAMDTNPDGTTRRMKFPRTKRDRYRQEGKLYESLSGTQLDGAGLHVSWYTDAEGYQAGRRTGSGRVVG